jgi:hypothetical protein
MPQHLYHQLKPNKQAIYKKNRGKTMNVINVPVVEEIMSANDQLANANRKILDAHGVFGLNIMSSPGSGKTSTIVSTQERLKDRFALGYGGWRYRHDN